MAESKSLKKAVHNEMKEATANANEGDVATTSQEQIQRDAEEAGPDPRDANNPSPDLPTGARSHPR